jgi:hypothetical protein
MTTSCDMRDILVKNTMTGAEVWGLNERVVSPEAIQEITRMGDNSTFLNAMGFSPTEDRERLHRLASFLASGEAAKVWRHEGRRRRVADMVNTASEILPKIANSLTNDSSPGRIGRLLRAMPIMAGCQFTPLGDNLSRVLKVEPVSEAMIVAYSETFCKRDEAVLAAIDRMIVKDQVLGPVAVELTGRLLQYFGFDGYNLDKKSRESLIDCLVLLVSGALEKVKDWDEKTNG